MSFVICETVLPEERAMLSLPLALHMPGPLEDHSLPHLSMSKTEALGQRDHRGLEQGK